MCFPSVQGVSPGYPKLVAKGSDTFSTQKSHSQKMISSPEYGSAPVLPPVSGIRIGISPRCTHKKASIAHCLDWGVAEFLPRHLQSHQLARLIQNTQQLLDNSKCISAAFKEISQHLEIPAHRDSFDAVFRDMNVIVWQKLVADMHDEAKFLRPKTYHTQYHGRELYGDMRRVYAEHPMGMFFASLGLAHDLIQDYPPQYGTDTSTNEDQTADFVCDYLHEHKSKLHLTKQCFDGLLTIARTTIVQGTYLVNFAESEGLLMLRLLQACSDHMSKGKTALLTQIKELAPLFEVVAFIGLGDIHRISFPGVISLHQSTLLDAGYHEVLGMKISDLNVSKMLYWASHSVRISGELATYRVSDLSEEVSAAELLRQPSEFHHIFSELREAFISKNREVVSALLGQTLLKTTNASLPIETKPFFMHIYDHLIADRDFIEDKHPAAVSDLLSALYAKRIEGMDRTPYLDVIATHDRVLSAVDALAESDKPHAIESFVQIVMYGAVFQEGYRMWPIET